MIALACFFSPAFADESLRLRATWNGITAGFADVAVTTQSGSRTVTITAKNAPWLDGLYPIDDRIISEGRTAGGSVRYQTWFREGGFLQDMDLRFGPFTVDIARHQLEDGAWRDYQTQVKHPGAVEDPISAFYRIREANLAVGQVMELDLFNGKRTVHLIATCLRIVPGGENRFIQIRAASEGDFRGGIDLTLTPENLPALAILQTRAGPVRIEVQ